MTKTSIILGLTFTVVFAAGILFGLAIPPMIGAGGPHGGSRGPEDRRDGPPRLDLSEEQRRAIDDIWRKAYDATREPPHETHERLLDERDEKVRALLNDEHVPDFDRIQDEYSAAIAAEEAKRREAITTAIEATRALLTEEQRRQFDAMRQRSGPGGPPRFAPHPRDHRGGDRPPPPPGRDGRPGGGPPPFGGPPPDGPPPPR